MARYLSDQNKVVFLHESGTYSTVSGTGQWIGRVTSHSIDDAENLIESRFLGTSSRSFGDLVPGPLDVTGTLNYQPQDMRIVFFGLGSIFDTSGTQAIHTATEINTDSRLNPYVASGILNPPKSFTLEDSKQATGVGQNFIRTVNGIVPNSITLSANQSEVVTVTVDYIGQIMTYSSGTTTSVTEMTNTPYLWNNVSLTVNGSVLDTLKSVDFVINNNLVGPHYVGSVRTISVPFPQNRDYTVNATVDLNSTTNKMLYSQLYKGGSSFNATLDLNADTTLGSQHAIFNMSGCEIMSMKAPSTQEGVTESTIVIRPKNVNATEWTRTAGTYLFNPF